MRIYLHATIQWNYYFVVDDERRRTFIVQHTSEQHGNWKYSRGYVRDVGFSYSYESNQDFFKNQEQRGTWIRQQGFLLRLWVRWQLWKYIRAYEQAAVE